MTQAARRPRNGHADLRASCDLALARLAAELQADLVQMTEAVQPAGRQLAAAGGERQLAVKRDPRAALDERSALALAAEAQALEPEQAEHAEAVVQPGDVDVGRLQVGARPQVRAGAGRSRLASCPPTGPTRRARAARCRPPRPGSGTCGRSGGVLARRDDHGGGAVDRDVAVEQAQRVADHLRRRGSRRCVRSPCITAFGLSWALRRAFSAIAANCSRVVPNSCMCRMPTAPSSSGRRTRRTEASTASSRRTPSGSTDTRSVASAPRGRLVQRAVDEHVAAQAEATAMQAWITARTCRALSGPP